MKAGDRRWPCYFFESDTTGEKDLETFHDVDEPVDFGRFVDAGVVLPRPAEISIDRVDQLIEEVGVLRNRGGWSKQELIDLVHKALGGFNHLEKNKYLDDRM